MEQCSEFGYPPEQLRKYLQAKELNNATTTYFLLESAKRNDELDKSDASTPT